MTSKSLYLVKKFENEWNVEMVKKFDSSGQMIKAILSAHRFIGSYDREDYIFDYTINLGIPIITKTVFTENDVNEFNKMIADRK